MSTRYVENSLLVLFSLRLPCCHLSHSSSSACYRASLPLEGILWSGEFDPLISIWSTLTLERVDAIISQPATYSQREFLLDIERRDWQTGGSILAYGVSAEHLLWQMVAISFLFTSVRVSLVRWACGGSLEDMIDGPMAASAEVLLKASSMSCSASFQQLIHCFRLAIETWLTCLQLHFPFGTTLHEAPNASPFIFMLQALPMHSITSLRIKPLSSA